MAFEAKNILVGAAPLFLSNLDSTSSAYTAVIPEGSNVTTYDTTPASLYDETTKELKGTLGSAYSNVGYTNNGLQITYNPTYGSVTVDQLLDTAKLFKEAMEVMVATELSEATLSNIVKVFGQESGSLASDKLSIAAGALGSEPTERQLIAIGLAPRNSSNKKRERVYYARRVLSVQQSQFSLARNTATTFPVTFRLLPDSAYAGAEYGKIIDRVIEA